MSLTPKRPQLENDVANIKERVRILEAQYPQAQSTLIVTDGSSSDIIDPTSEIIVGPGLELTNPGSSIAEIEVDGAVTVNAPLTATTVNPNLGDDGTSIIAYVRLRNFIQLWGTIDVSGLGVSLGTGTWSVALPSLFAGVGSPDLGPARLQDTGAVNIFPLQVTASPDLGAGNGISFIYPSSLPFGAKNYFGSGSGWTLAAGDDLIWQATVVLSTDS